MEAPRVSAVLVNFRTAHHLAPCLLALLAAAEGTVAEVLLVDPASPDREDAREAVAGSPLPVTFVPLPENRGFGAAANAGAARARAPLLLFVNPDARPGPGALAALVSALDGLPGAAAAGPRLVDARGRPQTGDAGPPPSARGAWAYALGRTGGLFAPRDLGSQPRLVGWLSGAFLLVRADAFRAASGFDESFFLFGEDVDLGRRLARGGRASWLIPGARVVHEGGASYRRAGEPSPLEGRWAVGLARAHERSGAGALARASFGLALGVGLVERAVGHALGLADGAGLDARERRARARALGRAVRALARGALSTGQP